MSVAKKHFFALVGVDDVQEYKIVLDCISVVVCDYGCKFAFFFRKNHRSSLVAKVFDDNAVNIFGAEHFCEFVV